MSLPRIAIPEPTSTDLEYNQRSMPQYVHAVESAGGIAVPIPLLASSEAQASLLNTCAAILLPGSPADLDPGRYGQAAVKECTAKDAARETADDLLLENAFAKAKPILGICYGLQSLNVWRHGALIQHLPDQGHGILVNHQPGREVQNAHAVLLGEGSLLSRILDNVPEVFVNSSHHQAIDRPGEGLRVVATSPMDGVIEALEGTDPNRFLVAVQWHPERSYECSAASRALFAAFMGAARSRSSPESS